MSVRQSKVVVPGVLLGVAGLLYFGHADPATARSAVDTNNAAITNETALGDIDMAATTVGDFKEVVAPDYSNVASKASNSVQYVADKNGNPTAVTIGHRLTNYLVGVSAFALGTNTAASGTCSIAMGYRAYATNDYSFVWYGNSSSRRLYTSHGDGTFNLNPVGGLGGVYIGATSLADTLAGLLPVSFTNQANVALGQGAEAKEYYSGGPSVAIGNGAKAPKSSTAVGAGAKIDGAYGTAVGRDADASSGSTALGDKSKATGHNSSALGRNAQATNDYSVALGGGAWSFGVYSTAAGEGAMAYGNYSTAVGGHSYYPEYSWEDTGPGARAYGTYSTALGSGAAAEGYSSTALGSGAAAEGDSSTALGDRATASGAYSTALGSGAAAEGYSSTALGFHAQATHTNSVVLNATGSYRYSQGDGTITLAVKNGLADVYVGKASLADLLSLKIDGTTVPDNSLNLGKGLKFIGENPLAIFDHKYIIGLKGSLDGATVYTKANDVLNNNTQPLYFEDGSRVELLVADENMYINKTSTGIAFIYKDRLTQNGGGPATFTEVDFENKQNAIAVDDSVAMKKDVENLVWDIAISATKYFYDAGSSTTYELVTENDFIMMRAVTNVPPTAEVVRALEGK